MGDFKNAGRETAAQGEPGAGAGAWLPSFPSWDGSLPMGSTICGKNRGWVSVVYDHDTSHLTVESIRRWWRSMGKPVYRQAQRLLITADSGGSNGSRVRLWKLELQSWPMRPPSTSRCVIYLRAPASGTRSSTDCFPLISQNWRGKPLVSHEVIVDLISATTTQTGLKVRAELDTNSYPAGAKVSKKQIEEINIGPNSFHRRMETVQIRPNT